MQPNVRPQVESVQNTPEYKIGIYWRKRGLQFHSISSVLPVILTIGHSRVQLKSDSEILIDSSLSAVKFKFKRSINMVRLTLTHLNRDYKLDFVPSPTSPGFSDKQMSELSRAQKNSNAARTAALAAAGSSLVEGATNLGLKGIVAIESDKQLRRNNSQAADLIQVLRNNGISVPPISTAVAPRAYMILHVTIAVSVYTIGFFPLIAWTTSNFSSDVNTVTNLIFAYMITGSFALTFYCIWMLSIYKGK